MDASILARRKFLAFALVLLLAATLLIASQKTASAAPTVQILSPANGSTISGTVTIKVKCSDPSGISSVDILAGKNGYVIAHPDDPAATKTYTVSYSWDTTREANGETLIWIDCYNRNGDYSGAQGLYTIKNIKGPTISWVSPSANQVFKDTVSSTTVKAGITKGEGTAITKVQFLIDDKAKETKTFTPAVNSATYTYTLDLKSLSLGEHTLKLHAENDSGGKTDSSRTIYRYNYPPGEDTWYLAEGTTDWGFSTYISVENPNEVPAKVKFTYMTKNGPVNGGTISMPGKSQLTVNPADKLGAQDFSTKVECLDGMQIAVDRTMTWNAGAGEEAHNSIGVTSPAKTWYLPEGSSKWGFETWLLIQNPGDKDASVTVTYMIEGESPKAIPVSVPANSRATYNMADHIGAKDASIKVSSDQPVIPERAMYRNSRREGHDSIGTTTPDKDFYLAEGTTGYGFTTYVLVQNPNDTPAEIDVTYMTGAGPVTVPTFQMPAQSRKTINVNATASLPDPNFSTKVRGSQPIIAERAMYWNNGTGEACHDSIGMAAPHTTFYLPDGETSNGRETWTLVQNPNTSAVKVEITYMTPTGDGNKNITDSIPANSRKSFSMAGAIPSGRAAIMVKSKTAGKKIMVERAMYWNSRGAGTDTIGGYGD